MGEGSIHLIERSEQTLTPALGRGMGVGGFNDVADFHDRGRSQRIMKVI